MNQKVKIALGLLAIIVIVVVILNLTTNVLGDVKNIVTGSDIKIPQINLQPSEIIINPGGTVPPPLSEGYQIEYANPPTDEELSKKFDIKVKWNNLGGFENVKKLKITRTATDNPSSPVWEKTLTKDSSTEKYFRSFGSNLELNFGGNDSDMPSGFNGVGKNVFTFQYTLGSDTTFKDLNTGTQELKKTIPRESIAVAVDSGIRVEMSFEPTVSSLIEIEPEIKNKGYYLHPLKMTSDGSGYEVDRAASLSAFAGKLNDKITIVTIKDEDSVYLKIGSQFFNPGNDEGSRLVATIGDATKLKVISITGSGDISYNIPANASGQGGQTNQTGNLLVLAKSGTGDSDRTEMEVITVQGTGIFGFRRIKDINNAAEYASMRLYYTEDYLFTGTTCVPATPVNGVCQTRDNQSIGPNNILLKRGQRVVTYEPEIKGVGGKQFYCTLPTGVTTPDGETRYNSSVQTIENCRTDCYYEYDQTGTQNACNAVKSCWKASEDEVKVAKKYTGVEATSGGTSCAATSTPGGTYKCNRSQCGYCGWNASPIAGAAACKSTPGGDPVRIRKRNISRKTETATCRPSPDSTRPPDYVADNTCPASCSQTPTWYYSIENNCSLIGGVAKRYIYRVKKPQPRDCKNVVDTHTNWRTYSTSGCNEKLARGGTIAHTKERGDGYAAQIGPTITNWGSYNP